MMILAVDIRKVWDAISDAMKEVAHITDAEWRPEDVYHSVVSGKSFLFMDSSDSQSFVVLSEYAHPYLSEKVLTVDIAYNKTGNAIDRYQSEIEDIAREAGCSFIEFSTPHEGLKRVVEKHGYETICTTYRKKL